MNPSDVRPSYYFTRSLVNKASIIYNNMAKPKIMNRSYVLRSVEHGVELGAIYSV